MERKTIEISDEAVAVLEALPRCQVSYEKFSSILGEVATAVCGGSRAEGVLILAHALSLIASQQLDADKGSVKAAVQ